MAALAKTQRAARAGVVLLDAAAGAAPALAQLACGALLAGYETTRFKSKPSPSASKLAEVVVMGAEAGVVAGGPEADAALAKARALALGNFVARCGACAAWAAPGLACAGCAGLRVPCGAAPRWLGGRCHHARPLLPPLAPPCARWCMAR